MTLEITLGHGAASFSTGTGIGCRRLTACFSLSFEFPRFLYLIHVAEVAWPIQVLGTCLTASSWLWATSSRIRHSVDGSICDSLNGR